MVVKRGLGTGASGRMRSSPRLKNPFSRRVRLYQRGVALSIGMLFIKLLARFDKALALQNSSDKKTNQRSARSNDKDQRLLKHK